jgi:hypothetical protein
MSDDRKRELPKKREPPKFMKPGDNPELDQALNRLRFDSDIYEPGSYDVFGQRRNMKGLRPSQRDVPPWGTPPPQSTEPTAQPESAEPTVAPEGAEPTVAPQSAEPTVAREHAEPAVPPVASSTQEREVPRTPARTKLWIAAGAVFAVFAPVTVVLVLLVPHVDPGLPPKSSAAAPSVSAAPSATAHTTATPEISSSAPQVPSSAPTTSAAVPPAPSPNRSPTGNPRSRTATDDPYDAAPPTPPAPAAPTGTAVAPPATVEPKPQPAVSASAAPSSPFMHRKPD